MVNLIKNLVITTATVVFLFVAASVAAAEAPASASLHDAKADALLKQMSDYISGLKSLSADYYVSDEEIMDDGFKLSVLRSGVIKIRRPDKLFISRKGVLRDQEIYFDGSHLVAYGKNLKMSVDVPVKGDLDAMQKAAADIFGAELPGRDIFSKDAYTPLMDVITESISLGSVRIGDMTCRQLAFRTDEVDLQLWVQEGDQPLPCRYTITSKWTYAAPQYTVTFANWKVNQEYPESDFSFTAPDGTQKTTVEAFKKFLLKEADKK